MRDKNNVTADGNKEDFSEDKNDTCEPKRTFAQACKECNAISLSQFEKEFWKAFYESYRKHGK